jgi:ornithine cyclodeaminase/alanine dehydrogenase-like protein (mu-crystallin family)
MGGTPSAARQALQCLDSPMPSAPSTSPPLRYLAAADVLAAMPPIEERLALAERAMTALATPGEAELPPKIGVHPRPEGSFAHAMPAHLRGVTEADDRLGMKWIAGFGGNAALGLPNLHGLVVINDPATGVPIGILDGGPITAHRTAAVSGVAIRHFATSVAAPRRSARVALIGAGVQARAHVPVIRHLVPAAEIVVFDRHADRSAAIAEAAGRPAEAAASARDATAGADIVISVASFTSPERRQVMTNEWLSPDALVIPVDYATYCSAEVARAASLFLVDHRDQFLANREAGQFDGYPEPSATLGDALLAATRRPRGRIVVTHLGVGLTDVLFGQAILRRAETAELGVLLPR